MRNGLLLAVLCLLASPAWSQVARFQAERTTWQDVRTQKAQEIILEDVYLDGIAVANTLRLQEFKVWADDAVVRIQRPGGAVIQAPPTHQYYRGYIDGLPLSRVMLSIKTDGRVQGLIADEGRYWMLEGAASQVIAALASREADWSEIAADGAFNCLADRLPGSLITDDEMPIVDGEIHEITYERNRLGSASYIATIAYETDNGFLNRFSDATEATNYIGDLTAYMSTLYTTEVDTAIQIGMINLWDGVTDPWEETGSTRCALFEVGKYWNDNNANIDRTIVHFLSDNSGGGIAWRGVLCSGPFNVGVTAEDECGFVGVDNYGGAYGVSFGITGTFNINNPSAVWDIIVVSHEVGHNFGSPHTHCYAGIGGVSDPVDECYGLEGGCFNGAPSLPCGQQGAGCGTIMSYCHLVQPQSLSNMGLTLGLGHPHGVAPERVPTLMNAEVQQVSLSNPECLPDLNCNGPSISAQPNGTDVCEGSQFSVSVTATGDGLSYQWRRNGQNISGATASTYSVNEAQLSDAGAYDCVITNACSSVTSQTVNVGVESEATFTSQPDSLELCAGNQATFSVTVSGSVTSYQWFYNGDEIPNATSSTYTIPSTTANDAGTYHCQVNAGECGLVVSDTAVLTVNPGTTITSQPTSDVVCEDDPASLIVVASGTGLTYQWRRNGTPINGATNATYSITSAQSSDTGTYTCVISSASCPDVITQAATLGVSSGALINQQPQDAEACVGAAINLSVIAVGENITYQWRQNGQNIPGANSPGYNIPAATLNDSGEYTCFITTLCGEVVTDAATVTVADGLNLIQGPVANTVCENEQASFTVVVDGANPNYQWRFNGVNISGATSATYIINAAQLSMEGTYDCVVTSDCGSTTTPTAQLNVTPLPVVNLQPQGFNQCTGETLLLTTGVAGTETVSYQWMKDGQEVVGANASTLEIPNAQPSDSGIYSCIVRNNCGPVTTAQAVVSIDSQAQVVLDQFVYQQAGEPVTVGFGFAGCEIVGPTWEWRNAQTQQVYGSDTQTLQLPLLNETTVVELVVLGDGGQFNTTETLTILVTTDTTFYDPNGDGCLNGDDVAFLGPNWLGEILDADGNNFFDVRDLLFIDTSGACPGLPRTAKMKP
jgi:hypothetical protein